VKAYSGYGLISHLYNIQAGLVPAGAAAVATIMDYFGMALTGAMKPLLHSSNAASLGLYDLESHAWRRDILREYGEGGDLLPGIVNRYQPIGSYRGVPVAVAIGDNQASFLGSVRRRDEEILINMGTGGQVSLLSGRILEGEELETRPFNEDGYLAVGSSLCGGRAYALLARFFGACAEAFEAPTAYGVMGMRERALHFGGNIAISSEIGRGSAFTLVLPLGQ
jgi:sedoheptulokinase